MATPNTGLAPVDQMRGLLKQKEQALKNFLGDEKNALRFMSSVMHCIQTTPKLLECDKDSLMGAFMECAALSLYPGSSSGDCFVLPYKTKYGMKAQFQIGYKGLKTLAYRAGVKILGMEVVYSKDEYREELGTNPRIIHVPSPDGDRGEPIRAYAWAVISEGAATFKSMHREAIMKIKKMSKAGDYGPWNQGDPMYIMWQKTAFKQLAKMLPTSEALNRAIHADNVGERGGYYEKEGELVEVPFTENVGDEALFNEICEAVKSIKSKSEYSRVVATIGAQSGKLNEDQQAAITELCKTKQAELKKVKEVEAPKKSPAEKVVEQMADAEGLNRDDIDPATGEITEKIDTAAKAEEIFNPAE